jgi:hypothetical protein
VAVYSSIHTWKTFTADEVIDEKLGIRIPFAEIFPVDIGEQTTS